MKLYHGDRAEQHIVRKRGAFVDAYMKPRNQNRQRKKTCPNSHIRKRKVAFSIDRLRAFKRRLLSIDLDATQGENAFTPSTVHYAGDFENGDNHIHSLAYETQYSVDILR